MISAISEASTGIGGCVFLPNTSTSTFKSSDSVWYKSELTTDQGRGKDSDSAEEIEILTTYGQLNWKYLRFQN